MAKWLLSSVLTIAALVTLAPRVSAQSSEALLELTTPTGTIHGTLALPASAGGAGVVPVVLLIVLPRIGAV